MTIVLAGLIVLFLILFVGRVGAARRSWVAKHWPVLALGGGALVFLSRGALPTAALLAAAAGAAWLLLPLWGRPRPAPAASFSRETEEAFRLLGLRPGASRGEIRAAYRMRMREAHPDRGGDPAFAARLTAARDLLLKGR